MGKEYNELNAKFEKTENKINEIAKNMEKSNNFNKIYFEKINNQMTNITNILSNSNNFQQNNNNNLLYNNLQSNKIN